MWTNDKAQIEKTERIPRSMAIGERLPASYVSEAASISWPPVWRSQLCAGRDASADHSRGAEARVGPELAADETWVHFEERFGA